MTTLRKFALCALGVFALACGGGEPDTAEAPEPAPPAVEAPEPETTTRTPSASSEAEKVRANLTRTCAGDNSDFCTAAYAVIARWVAGELTDEEFVQAIVDLLPPAAGTTGQGGADCRQPVEASVPVDNDERMVVGVMLGEFSQGDTKVTVDSTLPEDTGLEVILPSELESGGETIEELVITLRETDADVR